jgi:hypothetical protein
MNYYLQNPADPDVMDTDQPDPEADTESDLEVNTEGSRGYRIRSTYIEISDRASSPLGNQNALMGRTSYEIMTGMRYDLKNSTTD